MLHKGHDDAKGREGRRRTRRETEGETLSLSRAPPTFAPSLARPLFALGAARQIATGGKEGREREEGEEEKEDVTTTAASRFQRRATSTTLPLLMDAGESSP